MKFIHSSADSGCILLAGLGREGVLGLFAALHIDSYAPHPQRSSFSRLLRGVYFTAGDALALTG